MTGALPASERVSPPDTIIAFLVRVSIALHKHATYPPGHPALVAADAALAAAADALFVDRPSLGIGVARRALLIDGVPADSSNAVVKELAERLHRREVGGITLRRGVTQEDVGSAALFLCSDLARGVTGEVLYVDSGYNIMGL